MTRFNLNAKFTQEWKDAILASIELRRNPNKRRAHSLDCPACKHERKITPLGIKRCSMCPLASTVTKTDLIRGWCFKYGSNQEDERTRLNILDQMERAVRRRTVVE